MKKYLSRDISWLAFNERVIHEAFKPIPKLEQIQFLGIAINNLEEFLMTRYPVSIKDENYIMEGFHEKVYAHHDYLINKIHEYNKKTNFIVKYKNTKGGQRKKCDEYFDEYLSLCLQPVTVDMDRPIVPQNRVMIIVESYYCDEKTYSYIEVPEGLPPALIFDGPNIVMTYDIIKGNIHKLFRDQKIVSIAVVRALRSAEVYLQPSGNIDQYTLIKRTLKERQRSWITCLDMSCENSHMTKVVTSMIPTTPNTLIFHSEFINLHTLKASYTWTDHVSDKDKPRKLRPVEPFPNGSIFDYIRKEDRLAFHPYESYDSTMVRFLEEAAIDKRVITIKISLYRVADNSKIIAALLKAANNGKHVTVLVELKARFDESHNMEITTILKEGGVHVVYGQMNLKTHAKVCLVTLMDGNKLRVFSHVGTGNYNESNSKIYTDYSYFTANKKIGEDLTLFFNRLASSQKPFKSEKIVYAPYNMRAVINEKIDEQIKRAKHKKKARIIFKCNALTDDKVADKLIEAAKVGVKIDLIIRGACIICSQKNIHIRSIVGRFLEHSRIYVFGDTVYIGSNDIMYRNLNLRNELMIQITTESLKKRIMRHIKAYLKDTVNARTKTDKGYKYNDIKSKKKFNCQDWFIREAKRH